MIHNTEPPVTGAHISKHVYFNKEALDTLRDAARGTSELTNQLSSQRSQTPRRKKYNVSKEKQKLLAKSVWYVKY